jgi:hypothetical protein
MKAVKLDGGYGYSNIFKVKPGKAEAYQQLWKTYFRKILDGLFESGAITAYGLGEQKFHTEYP